jgi:hypothetical protein
VSNDFVARRSERQNGAAEPRSARVIPFARARRGASAPEDLPLEQQRHQEEEQEDLWLFACLGGAFVIALIRLLYAIDHRQEFGVDASLALIFVLGVPLLLRESVVNLAGRLFHGAIAKMRRRAARSGGPEHRCR